MAREERRRAHPDDGGFHRSSGYCRVNFGEKAVLNVSTIPLTISGMYMRCQNVRFFRRT